MEQKAHVARKSDLPFFVISGGSHKEAKCVKRNDNATLQCNMSDIGLTKYSKGGTLKIFLNGILNNMTSTKSKYELVNNSHDMKDVQINDVTEGDVGNYKCDGNIEPEKMKNFSLHIGDENGTFCSCALPNATIQCETKETTEDTTKEHLSINTTEKLIVSTWKIAATEKTEKKHPSSPDHLTVYILVCCILSIVFLFSSLLLSKLKKYLKIKEEKSGNANMEQRNSILLSENEVLSSSNRNISLIEEDLPVSTEEGIYSQIPEDLETDVTIEDQTQDRHDNS